MLTVLIRKQIASRFCATEHIVVFHGDCLNLLASIPDKCIQLSLLSNIIGRGVGAEVEEKYINIANHRIHSCINGILKTRPMNKPKYNPLLDKNKLTIPPWDAVEEYKQEKLLENGGNYLK